MLDIIECARGKLDDPIILKWALRRYGYAAKCAPEPAKAMERGWFDEETIRRWVEGPDTGEDMLADLLRELPARLFEGVKYEILQRWREWDERIAHHAISALLLNPSDDVVALFRTCLDDDQWDFAKTGAIIEALGMLPERDAVELLLTITNIHKEELQKQDKDDWDRRYLYEDLLEPMAALNIEAVPNLIKSCVYNSYAMGNQAERLLQRICSALFGHYSFLEQAEYIMEGDEKSLASMKVLFEEDAPLKECDEILQGIDAWPKAKALLEKYEKASDATQIMLPVIKAIEPIENIDEDMKTWLAVIAVLHAFEREKIDIDGLSMDEALDILTLDLRENRHLDGLISHLGTFEPSVLVEAAIKRVPSLEFGWGNRHMARMAGELRLVGMIDTLIDYMGANGGDVQAEESKDALAKIGEPAQRAIIEQWDVLDFSQKIFALGVLRQAGGALTLEFALKHFNEMLHGVDADKDDAYEWGMLAEAAPDMQALKLLEEKMGLKFGVIDESFYCLCVLLGYEYDGLDKIGERILEERRLFDERLQSFLLDDLLAGRDIVDLALKCEKCGDINIYEIADIIIGDEEKDIDQPFVMDEFPCSSCGEWVDFEFTQNAHVAMMASIMMLSRDREAGEKYSRSPVRFYDVAYRGELRSAANILKELKQGLFQNPDSIEDNLRLARVYRILKHSQKARLFYDKSLKLKPDSMEAGLGLACALDDSYEPEQAFDSLCVLLERKDKWQYFRLDELSPKLLGDEFLKLYRKLRKQLDRNDQPVLLPSAFERRARKVGRNDPCPCGSGKKYKKCCLGR